MVKIPDKGARKMSLYDVLLNDSGRYFLLGNEAIVRGLIEAGVGAAATYTGTPSSLQDNNKN